MSKVKKIIIAIAITEVLVLVLLCGVVAGAVASNPPRLLSLLPI
jgi:hypothetical protein